MDYQAKKWSIETKDPFWKRVFRGTSGPFQLQSNGVIWILDPSAGPKAIKDEGNIKKGMTRHIGFFYKKMGDRWITADGGQKHGKKSYGCGFVERVPQGGGVITGEGGHDAGIMGWVDMDRLYAIAPEAFKPLSS
ncbi:hypothetical protein CKO51_19165 [Rhodopirellula sp. SM50]|nr:hypothetical protein [Rhodopirellula sp. SM50]PAY17817.1 hypothetical protein CKO51_19165 [Rhodopirellula sp. SM50]